MSNFWGQFFMFSWPKNRFKLKKKYTIASALKKYIKKEFLNRLNNHNQLCIVLLEMPPCATSVEWLCIWCLMVSTDQADSHCSYFRISWILIERHWFYLFVPSIKCSTQPVQTLFLFKSIWIRPQRSQGCQKMRQDPLNMPFEVWCANIAPERHKLWKTVKKCQKTPVFIDFFKYSSFWGQYYRTKAQMARLVDPDASFDTPGTPGRASIAEIYEF